MLATLLTITACTADPPVAAAVPAAPDSGEMPVILVVGDSLSAAYGIGMEQGWVALLQRRLTAEGAGYRVINASISGDTTSGGLSRLQAALPKHEPALVVIELGANDGLRGIPLQVVERNLDEMIRISQAQGARVVLLGMRIPTNYGPRYAEQFHSIYQSLARRHELPFVEFFLDGVALDPGLMLPDGIHPNAAAQPRLLDNAWPAIAVALSTIK